MSKVLDVLNVHVPLDASLVYKETELNDTFSMVEIFSHEGTSFREWYYLVDADNNKVYYGDPKVPSGVTLERIRHGAERAV